MKTEDEKCIKHQGELNRGETQNEEQREDLKKILSDIALSNKICTTTICSSKLALGCSSVSDINKVPTAY